MQLQRLRSGPGPRYCSRCVQLRTSESQSRLLCACVASQGPPVELVDSTVATLLLGDIGGTNARFELVDADVVSGKKGQSFAETLPTKDYDTVEDALAHFLEKSGEQGEVVSSCALACAGPVVDNVCDMTNLKWVVNGDAIGNRFGMRTAVLNDFVAVGYAIPTLTVPDDVLVICEGQRHDTGPIAVLGPGTGLGETQLLWDNKFEDYVAWPSEGSHGGFAPRGSLQRRLLEFLEEKLPQYDPELALDSPCEVEHVACGAGLARIHRYLCYTHSVRHDNLTPVDITGRGLAEDGCEMCSMAIDVFLEIIGAEASAMALRNLATGGVFLAGGIPPRLGERLQSGHLKREYLNAGSKLAPVLQKCPLYVLRKEAGLRGVYSYAMAIAQGRR